jgi:hypothetical protein
MASKTTKKPTAQVDNNDHPLAAMIPPKDIFGADSYVNREIGGIKDTDILDRAREMRHNVLIKGPTGPGKTSFIFAYAAENNLPVVTIACNGGVSPDNFIGEWQAKEDGSGYQFVPSDFLLAVMHGGIIYLDEVNFMPPKIAAFIHGLLDKRRTMSLPQGLGADIPSHIPAHKNAFVIAAYNPDYEGTRPLNKAFKNRFAIKLNWGYERSVEESLVMSSSLLELAWGLRERQDLGDITTPISTNLLLEFEEMNEDEALGFDFAVTNFLAAFESDEQEIIKELMLVYAKNIFSDLNEGDFEKDSEWSRVFKTKKVIENPEGKEATATN